MKINKIKNSKFQFIYSIYKKIKNRIEHLLLDKLLKNSFKNPDKKILEKINSFLKTNFEKENFKEKIIIFFYYTKNEELLSKYPHSTSSKTIESKIIDSKTITIGKENKNTHILHINTIVGKGGASKIVETIHKNLERLNIKSTILADKIFKKENNVFKIRRYKNDVQDFLYRYQNINGLQDFFHISTFDLPYYNVFKNSNILHLHNIHGNYFSPLILPSLTKLKPTIWTLHDMNALTGHCAYSLDCNKWEASCGNCQYLNHYQKLEIDTTEYLLKMKKDIYKNSNITIVTPSLWLKRIAEKSILKEKEIKLIYNGIDTKKFRKLDQEKSQIRKKLNLPVDKTILVFTADGSINNPWKGGKYILQSYEILKNNSNLFFLNIGGDININKNQKNWKNIGYISNDEILAEYYNSADIFIYPSLADNCPLVVLEAQACGLPIITFETGGIPEIVKHNETGYIAKYKDLEDFLYGIKSFINNKSMIKKTGIEASEFIKNNFSEEKMVNEYVKLYEKILNNF